eukprot:g15108.t1
METNNNNNSDGKKKLKRTPSEERIYQERLKDRKSRKGLKQLKAEARAKRAAEKKLAEERGEKFVAKTTSRVKYDDTVAATNKEYDRNDSSTWSSTATKNGWKLAKK